MTTLSTEAQAVKKIAGAGFPWAARNGKLVLSTELTVPVGSLAMRYALSAFEGVRGYVQADGKTVRFFALRQHLQRLANTLEIVQLSPPPVDELWTAAHALLKANEVREDCYLRIAANAVSLGTLKDERATEMAYDLTLQPMGRKPWAGGSGGWSVLISDHRKPSDDIFPQRAKVISNYAGPRLAYLEAKRAGYDDVILRTIDGHLSEAPTANLFIVRDGKVLTPPASDAILLGITRQSVIQICRQAGIPAEECRLRPEDARSADEAFLTGTGLELMPIRAFDGKPIGGTHDIFSRIHNAYFEIVRNIPSEEYI